MTMPEYHDSVDSTHFLKSMLASLGKYSLPPNIINITLMYNHVSGSNKALSKELENILNTKNTLTEEEAKRLYHSHIWDDEKRRNQKLSEVLKERFAHLSEDLKDFIDTNSDSQKSLKGRSEELKKISDPSQITGVVDSIVGEMYKIVENNSKFEKELQQKQEELNNLKKELDVVKEQVDTDPMTQLKNRRFFESYLGNEMYLANRKNYPLHMIMLDIDHFKKVNDTYGHLTGDKVIIFVADTITSIVKDKAIVARIGGEEYAILFSNISLEIVQVASEAIRKKIADTNINLINKKDNSIENTIKVTVSQGITSYVRDEKANTFIDRADKALYTSKETGRNKVTVLN